MSIALRGFFLDMALSIFQTLAENRILNTAQSGAYYTTVNLRRTQSLKPEKLELRSQICHHLLCKLGISTPKIDPHSAFSSTK